MPPELMHPSRSVADVAFTAPSTRSPALQNPQAFGDSLDVARRALSLPLRAPGDSQEYDSTASRPCLSGMITSFGLLFVPSFGVLATRGRSMYLFVRACLPRFGYFVLAVGRRHRSLQERLL